MSERRLSILRLVHEYPLPWDGLTPGPYELSKAQVRLGCQMTILSGGFPHYPVLSDPDLKVRAMRLSLPYIGPFLTTMPVVFWHTRCYLKRHTVDVVHAHNHIGLYEHLWRRRVGHRRDVPYVLHLHVTAAGRAAKAGKGANFLTRRYEWALHRLSDSVGCQVADAVICCSESIRQEVIQFYSADPGKLHVVPNGVNVERFHPKGPNIRDDYSLTGDDRVVLYVGGITPRKNLSDLILSLPYLEQKFKLIIIGRGAETYRSKLDAVIREKRLVERVVWAGYVPYPELPDYYRSADVLVLPSRYEGFPKVILEALACGLPVICSKGFTGDDEIGRHITFLNVVSAEEIANAVRSVVGAGRQVDVCRIQEVYDWTRVAQAVQDIYATL